MRPFSIFFEIKLWDCLLKLELLTCYLQLKKVVGILVIMKMVPVMMKITMKPVSLMVEIAVDLTSIHYGAQNVSALKKEGEEVEELQHLLELQ